MLSWEYGLIKVKGDVRFRWSHGGDSGSGDLVYVLSWELGLVKVKGVVNVHRDFKEVVQSLG